MTAEIKGAESYWEAVLQRDTRLDGAVYYGVTTTGVYCRPSCASRKPAREHVEFFEQRDAAERAGFRPCLRCRPERAGASDDRSPLAAAACRMIESHVEGPLPLARVAEELGVSAFHLHRTFKAVMGVTPRAFAEELRVNRLKDGLQRGEPVTRAMYDAGFGSSSRLYERSTALLGMSPGQYRGGANALTIRYFTANTALGRMLVGRTDRGVCAVQFGESDDALIAELMREFPGAEIVAGELDEDLVTALRAALDGKSGAAIPLYIRATAFQRLVWEYLQEIPCGETKSYGQVAEAIGKPRAVRAVARACAANRVAVVIPCHRVVREDGATGGYRWGAERKQELLKREKENA